MRNRAWRWYLLAMAAVVLLHVVVPTAVGPFSTPITAVLSAVFMAWRGCTLRGGPRLGVIVVALALVVNAAADVSLNSWAIVFGGEPPYPGPPDVLYLAFYPIMAVGLFWLVKHRTAGNDRSAAIDSTIVTVGAAVVLWKFLILPLAQDTEVGLLGRLVGVAYPVGDLLLLAVTARLALLPGRRPPALRLLLTSLAALFVADIVYTWAELTGVYSMSASFDALYDVSYGLIAAAALHPSFGDLLTTSDHRHSTRSRWGRLGLLTGATLLAPVVAATDVEGVAFVPLGASAVMFLLVMARVAGLMRDVERSSEQRFRSLVQNATDFLLVVGSNGRVTYCSPSTVKALGIAPDDGIELHQLVHPDDRPVVTEALAAASGQDASGGIEVRLGFADDSWRTVEMTVTDLSADPDVAGFVINAHDIHDLRRLASFDPLTGLLNRAELSHRVAEALLEPTWMALLLYDLDGFKEINDSLGHAAGDAVLVEVARRLQAQVRGKDIVSRLGGDEFALVVAGSETVVEALAERTLRALAEPITLADLAVSIEASIGVVIRRVDHTDPQQLLRDADLAMYAAKAAGKGRFVFYDPSLGRRAMRHLEIRSALHEAVSEGQLELHYQPVFRLDTGHLDGFEALLRWQHPERGWISPADFIPAAEESNQIVAIGRWVIDQAARQLAQWRRLASGVGEGLTMAVNLSPRQLTDANLVTDVLRTLNDAGIEPAALCLEITEGAVVDNANLAAKVFAELRTVGVRLAIDDYGSGNASISYLRQFAVDTLKIDRSLIEHLDTVDDTGPSLAIVRSVIELATALGLTTVGEGIETEAQRATLAGLGCQVGQGFLLARPMDALATTSFLESRAVPAGRPPIH